MTIVKESIEDYTKRLKPLLAGYIANERDKLVEEHLEKLYWLYAYITEEFESKITKNKDLCRSFFPMMVEVQDLMRGILVCQQENLLATASLSLRTVFEIYINSKFIFTSSDPKKYLQRLIDFAQCEELLGRKSSPALPSPTEEAEKKFVVEHSYWAIKDGFLKGSPVWNGEEKSLKTLCEDMKLEEFYYRLYKPTSKFVHGSPVVRNMYKVGTSMRTVAPPIQSTRMCLLTGDMVRRFMEESFIFFGVVGFDTDLAAIHAEFETLATKG